MRRPLTILALLCLLLILGTGQGWAAINAGAVWEVRTTGSDTLCSGLYDPSIGTTDFSQQNSAQVTDTDLTFTSASGTVTSSSQGGFTGMKGNSILAPDGHTYEITNVGSNTSLTISPVYAGTTASSATGYIGGAKASPGAALKDAVAGNTVWVKAGTYTISSATANVSGGVLSLPGANGNQFRLIGYNTTRGDIVPGGLTRPILLASGIATTQMVNIASGSSTAQVENLEINCASLTSMIGVLVNSTDASTVFDVKVDNPTSFGIEANASCVTYCCEVSGGGSAQPGIALVSGMAFDCYVHDGTGIGFQISSPSGGGCFKCIAANNSGAGSHGFDLTGYAETLNGCVAYNNGGDGVHIVAVNFTDQAYITNTISVSNAAWGFNLTSTVGATGPMLLNDASYNNTSGSVSTNFANPALNFVTLTGNPFVSPSGGNYGLNATAGAGAALRAAGFPATFTGLPSTVNFDDIGPVQHQDSGGTTNIFPYSGQMARQRN